MLYTANSFAMLAKVLALALVLLAASPFTAPFATLKLDQLHPHHTSKRTAFGSVTVLVAVDDARTTFLSDPPVIVRPFNHGPVRLMPSILPGSHDLDAPCELHAIVAGPDGCPQAASARPLTARRI